MHLWESTTKKKKNKEPLSFCPRREKKRKARFTLRGRYSKCGTRETAAGSGDATRRNGKRNQRCKPKRRELRERRRAETSGDETKGVLLDVIAAVDMTGRRN